MHEALQNVDYYIDYIVLYSLLYVRTPINHGSSYTDRTQVIISPLVFRGGYLFSLFIIILLNVIILLMVRSKDYYYVLPFKRSSRVPKE